MARSDDSCLLSLRALACVESIQPEARECEGDNGLPHREKGDFVCRRVSLASGHLTNARLLGLIIADTSRFPTSTAHQPAIDFE